MPLAYKISDIVVSTSIEPEAFGRVAVEAQSMQKLILASNIGGSNPEEQDSCGQLLAACTPSYHGKNSAFFFDILELRGMALL